MRRQFLLAIALLPFWCAASVSQEVSSYEGQWRTTNRKLDGTMTCVVKELGKDKWQGRFYGVWQGTPFDYTVSFAGTPENLRGTATIDRASYSWKGQIQSRSFKGTFGGSRYTGSFDLRETTTASKPPIVRRSISE